MRDLLKKPVSELFKKNTDKTAAEQQDKVQPETQHTHVLNRPISQLFKKNQAAATENSERGSDAAETSTAHFLNTPISELLKKTSLTESSDPSQDAQPNIFRRPISELFKNNSNNSAADPAEQPTLQPNPFAPVMDKLAQHYQQILTRFNQLQPLIENQDSSEILYQLVHFREQFKHYLVSENGTIQHFAQNLKTDEQELGNILQDCRLEMHRFTNTVLRFLRKWIEQKPVSQQNLDAFEQDYTQTREVLMVHLQHEHTLFYVFKP